MHPLWIPGARWQYSCIRWLTDFEVTHAKSNENRCPLFGQALIYLLSLQLCTSIPFALDAWNSPGTNFVMQLSVVSWQTLHHMLMLILSDFCHTLRHDLSVSYSFQGVPDLTVHRPLLCGLHAGIHDSGHVHVPATFHPW